MWLLRIRAMRRIFFRSMAIVSVRCCRTAGSAVLSLRPRVWRRLAGAVADAVAARQGVDDRGRDRFVLLPHGGQDLRRRNSLDHRGQVDLAAVAADKIGSDDFVGRRTSRPLTSTLGRMASIRPCGVASSNTSTCDTTASAATITARSRSWISGRPGPFSFRTLESLLMATNKRCPSSAASFRLAMCPTCNRSKQPLVKTVLNPCRRYSSASCRACSRSTILCLLQAWSAASELAISSRRRTATPGRSTSKPAATFASRTAARNVDVAAEAQAEHGQHHVAGAGNVVDLSRAGRKGFPLPVGLHQHHAVAVERDQGHRQLGSLAQADAGRDRVLHRGNANAGGRFGLRAIRFDQRRPVILPAIAAAARIDQHRHSLRRLAAEIIASSMAGVQTPLP